MPGRGSRLATVALFGGLIAVAVFVWFGRDTDATVELVERTGSKPELVSDPATDSPFSTAEPVEEPVVVAESQLQEQVAEPGPTLSPIDIPAIAREGLSDDEFEALVERLRADPELLAALIDEARSETDPERLEWLLRVLGDVDDPAVVALATEYVYSGDPALQKLGLDLMKRVRPGDPDVLASVSGLLSSEVDGQVLVPALTALARPGDVDDGTRASLVGQVAILVDHTDASVRRTSLTILSRWSNDGTYTPQLLSGLDDTDQTVRRAAAYALVGHEDASPQVQARLTRLASDGNGDQRARRGAILALKRMELSAEDREQVLAIERRMNTRKR